MDANGEWGTSDNACSREDFGPIMPDDGVRSYVGGGGGARVATSTPPSSKDLRIICGAMGFVRRENDDSRGTRTERMTQREEGEGVVNQAGGALLRRGGTILDRRGEVHTWQSER